MGKVSQVCEAIPALARVREGGAVGVHPFADCQKKAGGGHGSV